MTHISDWSQVLRCSCVLLTLLLLLTLPARSQGLASAQTVTLNSSVEQAGRQAACPGEEVTFTCTVTDGGALVWIAEPHITQNNPVAFLGASATAGETRDPTAQIHIVLDDVSQGSIPEVRDFVSTLTVRNSTALSGTVIQCSNGINTANNTLMVGTLPSPPQNARSGDVIVYSISDFTVAVEWESPASDGGVGIDSYTLTGAGITTPLTVFSNEPLIATLTLSYNEMHMVSITASNCAGESTASLVTIREALSITCGRPASPTNGIVVYTTTTEGSLATFQCGAGLVPMALMTTVCEKSGGVARWSPNPGDLSCTDVPAPCNGALGSLSCDNPTDGMCYTASYAVQPDDSVTFTVSARTPANTWVGLGVSNVTSNADVYIGPSNGDIVLGASSGTNSFIHDRYAVAQAELTIDPSQDIRDASAERVDGVTTITFNRPRNSSDSNDISLDSCRFFFFAYGGLVNFTAMPPIAVNSPTHLAMSLRKICIPTFLECSPAASPSVTPTPTPSATPTPTLPESSDQAVVIAVVVAVVVAVAVAVVTTVIIVCLCRRKRKSAGAFVVKTEGDADLSLDYAQVNRLVSGL